MLYRYLALGCLFYICSLTQQSKQSLRGGYCQSPFLQRDSESKRLWSNVDTGLAAYFVPLNALVNLSKPSSYTSVERRNWYRTRKAVGYCGWPQVGVPGSWSTIPCRYQLTVAKTFLWHIFFHVLHWEVELLCRISSSALSDGYLGILAHRCNHSLFTFLWLILLKLAVHEHLISIYHWFWNIGQIGV